MKLIKADNYQTWYIEEKNKSIIIDHDKEKPVGDIGRSADYSKAKKLINWEPEITLEEGINDLTNWLKQNN